MSRDNVYHNDFTDGSLGGGTWGGTNGGTDIGVRGDQLALFTSENQQGNSGLLEGGKYTFPSSLVNDQRADHFEASMDVKLSPSSYAPWGNKMPDGMSFSFGNTNSFLKNPWVNDPYGYDYEKGVTEGLSINIVTYDEHSATGRGRLEITWNGALVARTDFTGTGNHNSSAVTGNFQPFAVSVADDGLVVASYGGVTVSGTIPNSEWMTQDQAGWDFAIAGRTGANGGWAHVDNLHVESRILLCFAGGTLLECEHGPKKVEALRIGDLVATRDHGLQPIRWIGRRSLCAASLEHAPHLRPIRITTRALGPNSPTSDLLVSPQHRILIRSAIAQRMFGVPEILVAAKQLCGLPGISVATGTDGVEYFHVMFDRHQIVLSNGAETESLFAGPQLMRGLGTAARAEMLELFPELASGNLSYPPARQIVTGRKLRRLTRRHAENGKPLTM